MFLQILLKELRGISKWAISLLVLLWFIITIAIASGLKEHPNPFFKLRDYMAYTSIFFAFLISKNLIYDEFKNRTWTFLEALPIKRFNFILIKYVIGFFLLFLIYYIPCIFAWTIIIRKNFFTFRYFFIVTSKVFFFLLFIFSISLMINLMGKYKALLISLMILTLIFLNSLGYSVNYIISQVPPLALMDKKLPFELNIFPFTQMAAAVAMSLIFFIIIIFFTIWRNGVLIIFFATKLSSRESVAAWTIAFLAVFFIVRMSEFIEKKKMVQNDSDVLITYSGTNYPFTYHVSIPTNLSVKDAKRWGESLGARYQHLLTSFPFKELPEICFRLNPSSDLSAWSNAHLFYNLQMQTDPFIIDTDILRPKQFKEKVRRLTNDNEKNKGHDSLYTIFTLKNYQRSRLERSAWFWDGLEHYVRYQSGDKYKKSFKNRMKKYLLLSHLASEARINPQYLKSWFKHRRRFGKESMKALGFMGLYSFQKHYGIKKMVDFMHEVCTVKHPQNIIGFLSRDHYLLPDILDRLNISEGAFYSNWNDAIAVYQTQPGNQSLRIPKVNGTVWVRDINKIGRKLDYTCRFVNPDAGTQEWQFCYKKVAENNEIGDMSEFMTITHQSFTTETNTMPQVYTRGDRLIYTFAIKMAHPDVRIIDGWQYITIK